MVKLVLIMMMIAGLSLSSMTRVAAQTSQYESLRIINGFNWVRWFDRNLGYVYDSHGCLHFTPTDIYLLYRTVPPGIPLTVKNYRLGANDPPFSQWKVPYLADRTSSQKDIERHALTFKNYKTELVAYPSLDLLFIMVNGYPYAKVNALHGPNYEYLLAQEVTQGKPIKWDFMLSAPSDPGKYSILRLTDHYLSAAYYQSTIVPFGAWIEKVNGAWAFEKGGKWHNLPSHVAADIQKPADRRLHNYYDVNHDSKGRVVAARYAGHDFGRYVMLWTKDGKNHYAEMGYAAGQLVYEQIMLVKDLVYFLTAPGPDNFEELASKNENFRFYGKLWEFRESEGSKPPPDADPSLVSSYKLYNGMPLSDSDWRLIDPRLYKAFAEKVENRLPRNRKARREALGLYNYLRINSLVVDKQAGWYAAVKNDWDSFRKLRVRLRDDFNKMGVLSLENRQNIVEGWITDRLNFMNAVPPKGAKYASDPTFSSFFKPDEELRLFSERERAVMMEKIKKSVKGESLGLELKIVDPLNNYNLGILLNEILGDLYKSHGCLHVSPRNMVFLYDLLPVGALVRVCKYTDRVSPEALEKVPHLAGMVNFADDLERLKERFMVTREVQVAVYPATGDWIIYLKGEPFARLAITGGPNIRFYQLQGRDDKGRPIFEDHLAYPTTPGDFYVFRKVEDYLSNLYREQTLIHMGGVIKRENGKWKFVDKAGRLRDVPNAVAVDLARPPDEREYTYYETVKDSSGEAVEKKWGSHPFGRYSILTTADRRNMWPEIIHSSGDLIMEERQLVNDLITVLTAPHDNFDDCARYSPNFDLYRICHEFVKNPDRTDLIQAKERAAYRLYYNLPLTTAEAALLPADILIADKVFRGKEISEKEVNILIENGIASRRSGSVRFNMEKILGLRFDTYQYVVKIKKYAHHYEVLERKWPGLSGVRRALLSDFNSFVIRDLQLFKNFMRELMLRRNDLQRLTQEEALRILSGMLGYEEERAVVE